MNLHGKPSGVVWPFLYFSISFLLIAVQAAAVLVFGLQTILLFLEGSLAIRFLVILTTYNLLAVSLAVLAALEIQGKKPVALSWPVFSARIMIFIIPPALAAAFLTLSRPGLFLSVVKPTALNLSLDAGPFHRFTPGLSNEPGRSRITIWFLCRDKKLRSFHLEYGTSELGPFPGSAEEEPGSIGNRHEFRLAGLLPDTRYYYRIPGLDNRVRTFLTPPGDTAKGFHFMAAGDTGNTWTGMDDHSCYGNVLNSAEAYYRSSGITPAFRLHLGDMVRTGDDLRSWTAFLREENRHPSIPLMTVMGNHDYIQDNGANYRYLFGFPPFYAFDYGAAHFLIIHPYSGPGLSADGPVLSVDGEQMRFIEEDLKRHSGKKWLAVGIHIPPLSTGDYNHNETLIRQLLPLLKKHRVDLVLTGHDHHFECFHVDRQASWGGMLFAVCGTGGSSLDGNILTRPEKTWKTTRHDRSLAPLFQDDPLTRDFQVYGEISWGFTDVRITGDTLTLSYYRWLDIDTFLRLTGQGPNDKRIPRLDPLVESGAISMVPFKAFEIKKARRF